MEQTNSLEGKAESRHTFSDYIVYVDESGDHSLSSANRDNPLFVLAFVVVQKDEYRTSLVPAIQKLKFDFWGHDGAILHGHEIRKARGDFRILLNAAVKRRSAFGVFGSFDKIA